ncbi:uncharacterized protein PAE49_022128 [Odontesthes bonariensis]|uniref:uncharacterized protein LOC142370376 n=1 Tax=Odontesthes bonariensis TaxID=219752 RepID=UPI003F58709A
MSTSDAAEPELSVVGGHTATPLCGATRLTRTATVRELIQKFQESGSFRRENHRGDTAHTERRLSANGPDDTRKARILSSDGLRKDEAARCAHSDVHTQSSAGPSFTSCLLLRLSKPELRLKRNLEPCSVQRHSLTEPLLVRTQDGTSQVNGRAPSPGTCSVTSLSETHLFPAQREEEVITVVNHEREITKDSRVLSNGDLGPREHEALHLPPLGSQQRSFPGSLTGTENNKHIKDDTKLESDPSVDMLSSTVATVLAPHWSGRLRRSKRFDGTSYPETQGNLRDVGNANRDRDFQPAQNQHRGASVLTDGSRYPKTVSSLSSRRNTVGWSAKSDPSSLDFESKRELTQTVSLDAGAISPSATHPSSGSLLFLDRNEERRNPQTGHQGAISSNPASSSLLLSYRRFNSNGRNSDSTSNMHEVNPSPLSSSSNSQNGKNFATQLSPTLLNNNVQERQKPLLSPTSLSYRTTEPGPVLSPTYSSHRERNISDTLFFSTSPTNREAESNLFTQQPQAMNRVQTSLRSSKQTLQSKGPPDRQQNRGGSERPISETFTSLPRHSPYNHSNLLKTHSLPRRTTLTSTSWWKQVSPEASSPLTFNDTTDIQDKPKTAVVPPFNHNSDMAPLSLTANKRPVSQIPRNRDNHNTTEPVWKGNMNLALNTQSPESERLYKQHYGSNLNNKEPQKPHSMSDGLSRSKISRATTQITLTHTKDPSKLNVNNTAFTANVKEFPPNSLNPRSSNPPRDSSSKLKSMDCPPRTSTTPASHNMDSQKFTKPSLSLDFTPPLSSHAPTSQTASGLPPSPNAFPFHSHPVSSQTRTYASSSLIPKFTNKANVTPLGFERSYPCIPKPFQPQTVPGIIPTVNSFSKANCSPVSTGSTTSSSFAAPSLSLLCVPATPACTSPTSLTASSLLTPPATPVITSPNSETSSPKGGSIFSNSPDREPKKPLQGLEGKKVRRVTWGDSVDVQYSEPVSVEKPDPPQVRANPVSPSKRPQSFPSIFSFLRSGSPGRGPSPVGPPNPKNTSIQVGKGGKYRSLSSDSADLAARAHEKNKQRSGDSVVCDQGRPDPRTPRQERTLSEESGMVQCRSSASLSLPPDFSSGYKLRYSSPPYSALMSNRQGQGESKTTPHRLPLFSQPSQSNYTPQLSTNKDSFAAMTFPTSTPSLSPVRPALPFQKTPATQRSPDSGLSDTRDPNNNDQDRPNSQIELLDNRVHIRSHSLPGDKAHSFSSTYVTETLVYSIKPKLDTSSSAPRGSTPKNLKHNANTAVSLETKLSQQSHTVQRGEAGSQPCSHSDQSSNGSRSRESQSRDHESSNRGMKESKSRFYSVEVNNEQSPKRSRFALKKSDSAPNSVLSRTDSDRVSKSYTKMDQVFNKLRRKFSSRQSDDDLTFPWKWRRASQTPSLSGCSDVSSVSDNSADSTKTLEDRAQGTGMALSDKTVETDWTHNRYTVTPPPAVGDTTAGYQLSVWSEKSAKEVARDEQKGADSMADSKVHLSAHNPAKGQFESYENSETDFKATNQLFACRDPSTSPIGTYPAQCRKSTPSPRSPFSPFSSLSPHSPCSSADVTDDSVFYSPKLQRRRESSSPCEPKEGFSLGSSRRSRASIGPPSAGPVQDKEHLASSYADLKYGIEPGRSFSVSSVLSSRPSGPGRISTGSRFMSVGDLSQSALSCGSNGRDWDQGSVTPDWTREFGHQVTNDGRRSYLADDPGKMRSRSLPRSLTRCLANWSSGVPPSQPVAASASKPARLRSPNMNTCHFAWDTEGPPTPPPTPPLSPASRRMSKPRSLSSPTFPGSSGALQQVDAQSSRGRLPSRDYVSSLSAFDESSDSSSDTTTDDEYYLEADEDGDKETEL